jgi:hypothetical protein
VHDAARQTGPQVRVHQLHITRKARLPRWVLALILVAVLGGVAFAAVGLFVGWRAASTSIDLVARASNLATGASERAGRASTAGARTTTQLKDLPAGYHALQVAPPAGGYGSVEPIAALPWALAIAQAWNPDARLERIDVSRLRPDGTLNVQDDAEASLTYRFGSRSTAAALREQAQLQSSAEAGVGLWVRIQRGQPQVYSDVARGSSLREGTNAPYPDAEALTSLLERPAVTRLRGDLPFLNGYLIHIGDEGWVWYFSSLANESKPRVRARDGAVWPYPRRNGNAL